MKQTFKIDKAKFIKLVNSVLGISNTDTSEKGIYNSINNILLKYDFEDKLKVEDCIDSGYHCHFVLVNAKENNKSEFFDALSKFDALLNRKNKKKIDNLNADDIINVVNELIKKSESSNDVVCYGLKPSIESALRIEFNNPREFHFFATEKLDSDINRALFTFCKNKNLELVHNPGSLINICNFFIYVRNERNN